MLSHVSLLTIDAFYMHRCSIDKGTLYTIFIVFINKSSYYLYTHCFQHNIQKHLYNEDDDDVSYLQFIW